MSDPVAVLPAPPRSGSARAAGPALPDPFAPFPTQIAGLKQAQRDGLLVARLGHVRIALLSHGTLNHLAEVIRYWLLLEGFSPEIYICGYGSYRQEVLDPDSAFYRFKADVVCLLSIEREVSFPGIHHQSDRSACAAAVAHVADEIQALWDTIRRHQQPVMVQSTVDPPAVRTLGNFEAATPSGRTRLLQQLNLLIADRASQSGVLLFDLHSLAAEFGLRRWREERQWHQSKQPFSPNAYGLVAFQLARLVGAARGSAKKCVVLDLDNTLWGGVIGDDGLSGIALGDGAEGEAFVAFQEYLKRLCDRGVLLAVSSKNEESIARDVFEKHPGMRLRLSDIACFRANWNNKAENIRDIAKTLNLGLQALVFVDDNPAEREQVRRELPEVAVVELPPDPSDYLAAVASGCYFETRALTSEDVTRNQLYREEAEREAARSTATDLSAYLKDLDMEADSGPTDTFHLPRMTQLLSKTNQFHPTTTRHSEAALTAFADDPAIWMRWFSLRDRFGAHGLIAVVILRTKTDQAHIDSWAMSCRVFSRGMEDYIFAEILSAARARGARLLVGDYIPTPKNKVVAGLYSRLGFTRSQETERGERWVFDLTSDRTAPTMWIRAKSSTAL